MRTSAAGRAFLAAWEGVHLRAFRHLEGSLVIGVGHVLTLEERVDGHILIDGGEEIRAVPWRDGLSRQQVDDLLIQDLLPVEDAVMDLEVTLAPYQFDALSSFAYNIGVGQFRRSTLAKHIRRHDFVSAPSMMASWIRVGGKIVDSLRDRRAAEGVLFSAGEYRTNIGEHR